MIKEYLSPQYTPNKFNSAFQVTDRKNSSLKERKLSKNDLS